MKQAFINFLYINRDKIKLGEFYFGLTIDNKLYISQPMDDEYLLTIDTISNYIIHIKGFKNLYRSFKVLTIIN